MREQETGQQREELDSLIRGFSWDRLSAVDWRNELVPISYLYYYDQRARRLKAFLSIKEFTHHLIITVISFGLTGYGISELIGAVTK